MRLLKNIHSVFISSLLTTILISTAFAGENCVQCDDKNVSGAPTNTPLAGITEKVKKPDYSFESDLSAFCMRFLSTSKNGLDNMFQKLENEYFPVDDYFQIAGCRTKKAPGDVKSPMLHLTLDAPCSRIEYPKIVNDYYKYTREQPELWEKVVNAKNSAGETYLDYIETLINENRFTETKGCVNKLIAFVCGTKVAIYSKYNKTCPSTPTGI